MFQAFLGCLVRDVASFMVKLFDMAKQAVVNIINTLKGWIQASIDWAVRKIQELWTGITGTHRPPFEPNLNLCPMNPRPLFLASLACVACKGTISAVTNFLGRRLEEELTGEDIERLTGAIKDDESLSSPHKRQLLDMCSQIQVAKDAATEVCLLYTSPSPRDRQKSRMPSSA